MANTKEKQFKAGKIYFDSVSVVLGFGHLPSCLWSCDGAVHHGRKACQSKTAHLILAKKQSETGRGQGQDTYFRGMLPVTYFLQLVPSF